MTNPDKLNKLMTKHGWTEAKVAEMLGLECNKQPENTSYSHNRTVYRYKTGETNPAMGWDNLFKILSMSDK